jgi:hypothetical protein
MRMRADRLRDRFGWGIALWLVGYLLGIVLYFLVPPSTIGWVMMPVATLLTAAVLWGRVRARALEDFAMISLIWTAIAIAGDYLFIVRLLHPPDGYYKPDVYLYYALTFGLPLIIGWRRYGTPA